MNKIITHCIILLLITISQGHTHDDPWYVGIDGGYSLLGSEKAVGGIFNSRVNFKNGAVFGAVFGYDYGNYRVEGEVGKHLHNVNSLNIANDGGLGLGGTGIQNVVSGKSNHTRYMLNIIYDIQNIPWDAPIEPFVGTGVGLSNIKWSNIATANNTMTDDAESVFSYQLFTGVRYNFTQNLEMSLKYRYFRSIDVDLVDRLDNPFDISYDTHDFIVGLVYHFGGSAQPSPSRKPRAATAETPEKSADVPMPATQPAPINKGPYKVYFEWDSSEIDDEGMKTIKTAASEAKRGEFVVIELDGHADRSGPEEYNETLSMKRAVNVKNVLVDEKIDSSMISVEAHGERDPEIATPDGVREWRNRRVVILIK